jgi:hypothetical protein
MEKKILFTTLFMILALSTIASSIPYSQQTYSQNKPSYYAQYDYRVNNYYYNRPINLREGYSDNQARRWNAPYLVYSNSCNTLYGCRQVATSHMYVDNALDYAYYKNPELLAPRYMDNHQRYVRGIWPQKFLY